jgi:hypothetical protein
VDLIHVAWSVEELQHGGDEIRSPISLKLQGQICPFCSDVGRAVQKIVVGTISNISALGSGTADIHDFAGIVRKLSHFSGDPQPQNRVLEPLCHNHKPQLLVSSCTTPKKLTTSLMKACGCRVWSSEMMSAKSHRMLTGCAYFTAHARFFEYPVPSWSHRQEITVTPEMSPVGSLIRYIWRRLIKKHL